MLYFQGIYRVLSLAFLFNRNKHTFRTQGLDSIYQKEEKNTEMNQVPSETGSTLKCHNITLVLLLATCRKRNCLE